LLKDKLDALEKKHHNFHVHYVVEKAGMFGFMSPFSVGYVKPETVTKHCPPPADDNLILVRVYQCLTLLHKGGSPQQSIVQDVAVFDAGLWTSTNDECN
jgi:hypothetical protein